MQYFKSRGSTLDPVLLHKKMRDTGGTETDIGSNYYWELARVWMCGYGIVPNNKN
jgi:hypothetical protein